MFPNISLVEYCSSLWICEQNEEASPTLDPKPVVDDSTSLEELSRPYAHLQKKEMKAPVGSSTGTGELEESIESSRFH